MYRRSTASATQFGFCSAQISTSAPYKCFGVKSGIRIGRRNAIIAQSSPRSCSKEAGLTPKLDKSRNGPTSCEFQWRDLVTEKNSGPQTRSVVRLSKPCFGPCRCVCSQAILRESHSSSPRLTLALELIETQKGSPAEETLEDRRPDRRTASMNARVPRHLGRSTTRGSVPIPLRVPGWPLLPSSARYAPCGTSYRPLRSADSATGWSRYFDRAVPLDVSVFIFLGRTLCSHFLDSTNLTTQAGCLADRPLLLATAGGCCLLFGRGSLNGEVAR